ncbi:hypothetical protein XELAEV_18044785mg [Xenopus laevis]|uniref:Uncharacterized protein n=1 Tax=Xenopus laevis TaxID=8355 RepID=A0A974BZC5_XENLA|nr:hypothetical protein XELAEV_18044785mg [Xenopus laevis]
MCVYTQYPFTVTHPAYTAVTMVQKANVMHMGSGGFSKCYTLQSIIRPFPVVIFLKYDQILENGGQHIAHQAGHCQVPSMTYDSLYKSYNQCIYHTLLQGKNHKTLPNTRVPSSGKQVKISLSRRLSTTSILYHTNVHS